MGFLLPLWRCRFAPLFSCCGAGFATSKRSGNDEENSCLEDGMARKMPPLNPLHVFEASARLGSFTKAAEELGVTQSAVSRQVAVLEAYVRQRLFRRGRHGIALTPAGEAYRKDVAPAFARVAAATEKLR